MSFNGPNARVADSWNVEYMSGRYAAEPPVPFVADIVREARRLGISRGLCVGCGNGRNFAPLVEAGISLTGLDASSVAIQQLRKRLPGHADRLHVGDLSVLPAESTFPLVIGIQVFQHGLRPGCHENIRASQRLVEAGGLYCLRENAIGSQYGYRSESLETHADGSETIQYLQGPKQGLATHFFSRQELEDLFAGHFRPILSPRRVIMHREPPARGHWDQWEAIWQKDE